MLRARRVLPVPLSPSIKIVARVSAMVRTVSKIPCMVRERLTSRPSSKRTPRSSRRRRFSERNSLFSSARSRVTSS